MTRRWVWAGAAVVLIVAAGAGIYRARAKPEAQPQRARDPGVAVLLAIRTLERTPDTRLTPEQIARIVPFVKALKDMPASDTDAAAVIARAVRDAFTPEQQAALEEARTRVQERLRGQGAPRSASSGGEGGPPGGAAIAGPGGAGPAAFTDEQRAQMRARSFERMIRYLERRMK
jgi:hypothetical protein